MNIDTKTIIPVLRSKLRSLFKHAKFIFIITIVVIGSFLVFQINRLSSMEPTEEQLTVQQEIIKRPRIDQATINKIEQLKDQNIAVQSLFDNARNNPFQD